jgi:hypothetical protein
MRSVNDNSLPAEACGGMSTKINDERKLGAIVQLLGTACDFADPAESRFLDMR